MTARRCAALVRANIRRSPRQFLLSAFGIAVGIAALTFFGALSGGVRAVVLGQVFHADRIEVEPSRAGFDLPLGMLGGPRPITDDTVATLRAIDGVGSASPRLAIAFPAKAWGGAQLFGQNRYAELLGEGLDPAAVATESGASRFGPEPFADLEKGGAPCNSDGDCHEPEYCAWDVHQCQRPVPALVSRVLLELYNGAFAPSHGLPRISGFLLDRMRGFTFTVELGASFVGPSASRGVPRQRRIMIVGVSDRAIPIGLSLPLPYVQRWNAEYAGVTATRGYSSVTLEIADRSSLTKIAARVRELGFGIADSGAEQAGLAITLVTLLFALVSLCIIAVAATNIAHSFFRAVAERRKEIGVMRAVGASARDVEAILLGEAAAVGLCGGIAGVLAALLCSRLVDAASGRFVPDFPFKPESYFHYTPGLILGAVGFAVLACLVGAAWPARAAARLDPAQALSM